MKPGHFLTGRGDFTSSYNRHKLGRSRANQEIRCPSFMHILSSFVHLFYSLAHQASPLFNFLQPKLTSYNQHPKITVVVPKWPFYVVKSFRELYLLLIFQPLDQLMQMSLLTQIVILVSKGSHSIRKKKVKLIIIILAESTGRDKNKFTATNTLNTVCFCIINYCVIFHTNHYKPTFAPPCIRCRDVKSTQQVYISQSRSLINLYLKVELTI